MAKVFFFFLMYQKFLHRQVSAWRPTIMSPLLPLSLRYSRLLCRRGDTHSTSCALPNTASASACIPVQSRLCLNLCKLTQVSEQSPSNIHRVCSWQTEQQRSHGGKKGERKKLAEKEDWQAWREDWQKEKKQSEHWRLSLPPAVWLGWVLVAVQLQLKAGDPATRL